MSGASWYPEHRASFEAVVRSVVERRAQERAGTAKGTEYTHFYAYRVPDDLTVCLQYCHDEKDVLVDVDGMRERKPSVVAMVEATIVMYLSELCGTEGYGQWEDSYRDQQEAGNPSITNRRDTYDWLRTGILSGTSARAYVHLPLDLADRLDRACRVLHVVKTTLVIGCLAHGLSHSELWLARYQDRFTAAIQKFSRWLFLPGRLS
jgi:hypothetical protein